jgi:hypothetical protein
MSALVLGLLVGSAKGTFDAMNNGITEIGAKTIMLDRVLAQYGTESKDARNLLRLSVVSAIKHVWPEEKTGKAHIEIIEKATGMEEVQNGIMGLEPKTNTQRMLQAQAVRTSGDLAQLRWTLIEHRQKSLPTIFLVVLGFWFSMLYITFGLFAPRHATVIAVLCISALSVSGALFLVLEMNGPLDGMIKVSSGPMQKVLNHLGR